MAIKIPKLAILMIGNMRSFNITYSKFEQHVLSQYDCDLYFTTYDKRFNFKACPNSTEEPMTEEKIRDVYGRTVKQITIVNQDAFVEPYKRLIGKYYICGGDLDRLYTIQKLATMAYDIFRGECTRNNKIYDIVIKMRPDMLFHEKLVINFSISDNNVIVPTNDSGGGFNDHMAYGRGKAMSKYFSYYRKFYEIDNLDNGRACDVSLIESGLRRNMEVARVDIIREPVRYEILRDIKPKKVVYTGKGQFYVRTFSGK